MQKPLDQYGSSAVGATGGEEEKDEEEKNEDEDEDDFELFGSDDNDNAEEVSGWCSTVGYVLETNHLLCLLFLHVKDEAAQKLREKRLEEYAAKKAKSEQKTTVIIADSQ